MKRLVQLIMLAVIVGGGYFAWQKFGASGAASYQVEQLVNKHCVALMKQIRDDGKNADAFIESTKKAVLDEIKAKTKIALNPDDFTLTAAGKRCNASVKLTVAGKTKTVNFSKVLE